MSVHMVIAPGEPTDRQWVRRDIGSSFVWVPRSAFPVFELVDPLEGAFPEIQRAHLQRWVHPAWRITLQFWVDVRLDFVQPVIPNGYALAGTVAGLWLDHDCLECRGRMPWHGDDCSSLW